MKLRGHLYWRGDHGAGALPFRNRRRRKSATAPIRSSTRPSSRRAATDRRPGRHRLSQPQRRRRAGAGLRRGILPALRAADRRRHAQARASVAFLSDVIESDGARLRGLDPGLHADPDQRREGAGRRSRPLVLPRPHSRRTDRAGRDRPLVVGATAPATRSRARSTSCCATPSRSTAAMCAAAGCCSTTARSSRPPASTTAARSGRAGCCSAPTSRAATTRRSSRASATAIRPRTNPTMHRRLRQPRGPERHPRRLGLCASTAAGASTASTTDFEISGNYVRTDRTESERSFEYNVES